MGEVGRGDLHDHREADLPGQPARFGRRVGQALAGQGDAEGLEQPARGVGPQRTGRPRPSARAAAASAGSRLVVFAGPEGRRRLLVAGEVAQGAEAVAEGPEHGDTGVDEGLETLLVGLERVPGDHDGLGDLVGEGHDVVGEAVGEPTEGPGQPDDDDVDVRVGGDQVEDAPAVLDRIGDQELGPVVDRVVDGQVVGDHLPQRGRVLSVRMGTGTPRLGHLGHEGARPAGDGIETAAAAVPAGSLAKRAAVSSSSSRSRTRVTPYWANRPSTTASDPAR